MCGFVCLYDTEDGEEIAARMVEKIAHRGPDATEVEAVPGSQVTMAHAGAWNTTGLRCEPPPDVT